MGACMSVGVSQVSAGFVTAVQGVCKPGNQGEDVHRRRCAAHVPCGRLHLLPQQPAAVWPLGQGHAGRGQ